MLLWSNQWENQVLQVCQVKRENQVQPPTIHPSHLKTTTTPVPGARVPSLVLNGAGLVMDQDTALSEVCAMVAILVMV